MMSYANPLKFTTVDKNGSRTDYYLPAGNYRDALALVDSLSSITSNRRKRNAPAEESKPRTQEEERKEMEDAVKTGNIRPATAEEIAEKVEQIKRRKAAATALVVGSAIASDAVAYIPPPPKPTTVQPPTAQPPTIQPPTTVQPTTTNQAQRDPPSKPDESAKHAFNSKYAEMFEEMLSKFFKQSDSASAKIVANAKQNNDSWIHQNKKLQAILQESINNAKESTVTLIKEGKNNSTKIVDGFKKHADVLVEENQKLQALFKETIAIQKANAADSKRIANSSNVRGFSLGRAQEQYSKIGLSMRIFHAV
ncbi:hypothetical protein PRIPAC_83197 [Pristionchus pacificus]|uniref:Uncharacterized protein n=1 Tax=Pristionchus pacificus TaxID=54126 RepID=A0A2A6BSV5_PRIPA|nr:hypothetical protein PRIPAC_83197 [Pristionchus pacificus]|eukprot:PDM68896.1 hypothetical protein PRIPAC_47198 [Pristionchus pacificus]